MHKRESDALSKRERAGSHATKPSPTGRVDIAPLQMLRERLEEPVEIYTTLLDKHEELVRQRECIDQRLVQTLPHQVYTSTARRRRDLNDQISLTRQQIRSQEFRLRHIKGTGKAYFFMDIAREVLDEDVYLQMSEAAGLREEAFAAALQEVIDERDDLSTKLDASYVTEHNRRVKRDKEQRAKRRKRRRQRLTHFYDQPEGT